MQKPFWLSILLGILLVGCVFPLYSQPTESVILTNMVIVPATLSPTLTSTIAPTTTPRPTATPYRPIFATVAVQTLVVRKGPGKVFPILHAYSQNAILIILGQAPGIGQWVLVETPDHLAAWAMVEFIDVQGDLSLVPTIEPVDAYKITGKVADVNGNPVWGVGFAIYQGSGANEQRTDVETDQNGIFTGYLPLSASGTWFAGYISVNAKNHLLVDTNLAIKGTVVPSFQPLTLPQTYSLNFTWK
jgi:hypothetical protein